MRHTRFFVLLVSVVLTMLCGTAYAQEARLDVATGFSVAGFRKLQNDVTAFISPVRDLNDEACALVKVVATADFVFSSPLGIVKRDDKTGEIWLYLPKGTKTLTIKHPYRGVLRDYRFSSPLESHTTYELRINLPVLAEALRHDTIIMTRTVRDTVRIMQRKASVPMQAHLLLTTALHSDGPSFGLMAAMVWRHGFYVHASSNLRSVGETRMVCAKDGSLESGVKPYYTGERRNSCYAVTTGAVHRLAGKLCMFEGVGYGKKSVAWQLGDSEGGGYAFNEGLSCKGLSGEVGLMLAIKRVSVLASVITIAGKQWQGCIGVGIKLGRD